jgi:formyltetrahydrofolate deformylase
METAVLLFQCTDQKGIVAKISDFILKCEGNIINADQHSTDPLGGHFFLRIEFFFDEKKYKKINLEKDFAALASKFKAKWKIFYKSKLMKMGIMVSHPEHCLSEILYLWKSRELNVEIPFILSNHAEHKKLAEMYKIPYYFIPAVNGDHKEKEILKKVKLKSDFLVLARYMQVLSGDFIKEYNKDIINIHHSFLPSFKGANPYKQAFDRGVKVIGATVHFVTEALDDGPIIEQIVENVSHKDNVDSLICKGKKIERLALAHALNYYIDHRVIRYENKTIVFA